MKRPSRSSDTIFGAVTNWNEFEAEISESRTQRLLNRVNGNPEELLREHNVNGLFTIRDLIRNKEKTIVELDAKFWRRYRKMNSEKKSQKLTGIHLIFK